MATTDDLGLLAATMGPEARVYHVGFVVPDLATAVAELSPALGVTFTEPMTLPDFEVHTQDGPRDLELRLVYSTTAVHVELIEDAPGTLWDFGDRQRGHHLGVWADDVAAEADRLDALGLERVWWAVGGDGHLAFSYHQTPFGFYIELVGTVAKSFYPAWFAQAEAAARS
jgi:catechol 2,3-dioxygenase-like lactoylglutathione lyase family enzyme